MPVATRPHGNQAGFSLVDTLCGIVILGTGLLALAAAFSQGMILMSTTHIQQVCKEKAVEAIESVTTARDTRVITWAQIRNQGNGGIFRDGPQPLRIPGADGMVNTVDDGAVETEVQPGPDGVLGTGDDTIYALDKFTRQIQITDVPGEANLRQIVVTVRYQNGPMVRQYQLTTFVSAFA